MRKLVVGHLLLILMAAMSWRMVESRWRVGAQGAVDFERDIRPLLLARCAGCHGAERQKGGLRLDRREDAVAKQALERHSGARGLRAILENAMLDIMYEIPSNAGEIESVRVTDATVRDRVEPEVVYRHRAA